MGLLTDPSDKDKPVKFILKYHNVISFVAYVSGIIWFALLAYQPFNAPTYFSENALLPGLVARDYYNHKTAETFLKELESQSKLSGRNAPMHWLYGKFFELGLDVNIQNFSLQNTYGRNKKLEGKNLYAILRAPRAASTEALVLSTSYRPSANNVASNNPSIALMYSLASFFREHTYWAKDIIFLIAEQDLYGFQAFLDAYHHSEISKSYLNSGPIYARSGSIQAAIHLEIHSSEISGVDLKIEGLNGQLPNLDLFNLVVELCRREDIPVTFQQNSNSWDPESFEGWKNSMKTLLTMIKKQASGTPSGAHGLYYRYAIHSLTIESFHRKYSRYAIRFNQMGRVMEGIYRSLNNLLEKFHQSFFFYLLPSTSRYISIGMYMPPFALIALPVLLEAAALWLKSGKLSEKQKLDLQDKSMNEEDIIDYNLAGVIPIYFFVHCLGVLLVMAPTKFDEIRTQWNFPSNDAALYGLFAVFCSFLVYPLFLKRRIKGQKSWEVLKCITMLELGTIMFALAMMNFSLGLCMAVIYTPVCCCISPSPSRMLRILKGILLLLISPLILLYLVIIAYTILNGQFDSSSSLNLMMEGLNVEKTVLTNCIENDMVFGNWMFRVICYFICPTWLLLWSLLYQGSTNLGKSNDKNHEHQD